MVVSLLCLCRFGLTVGWIGIFSCWKVLQASCKLACARCNDQVFYGYGYGLEAGTEEAGSWGGVEE
jgi:hypothetical protein